MEYLGHQVFQQMSDLLLYPVVLRVLIRYDFQLIVVEVSGCRKRGDAENRSSITAADAAPPVFQPYIFRQIRRVHKYKWFILACFFWHIMHLVSEPACVFLGIHTQFAMDISLSSEPPF